MNTSRSLPTTDPVGLRILAEYDLLHTQFNSPKQFARYIALSTRSIIEGDIMPSIGLTHEQDEEQIRIYRQFLITRARASGMRSFATLQEWYLDTFTELHKILLNAKDLKNPSIHD